VIDARADELEAKRLGGKDRDSVHPRRNVFRDAQRVDVAVRRYADGWVPRGARPGLQITDARRRRPASSDAERKHGGRDRQSCDSSDDGQKANARRDLPKVGSRATLTVKL
jgi:hypothetical protein